MNAKQVFLYSVGFFIVIGLVYAFGMLPEWKYSRTPIMFEQLPVTEEGEITPETKAICALIALTIFLSPIINKVMLEQIPLIYSALHLFKVAVVLGVIKLFFAGTPTPIVGDGPISMDKGVPFADMAGFTGQLSRYTLFFVAVLAALSLITLAKRGMSVGRGEREE